MRSLTHGRLPIAFALCAVLVAASIWGLTSGASGDLGATKAVDDRPASAKTALPAPVSPAFVPPEPTTLPSLDHVSWWSPVRHRTPVRARADRTSPVIASLPTRTPEGTRNVVLVLDRHRDAARDIVGASARADPGTRSRRLDLSIGARRLWLRFNPSCRGRGKADREALSERQAHLRGAGGNWPPRGTPTPRGGAPTANEESTRYSNPFYGPVAFGTSARSPTLTDWPAGEIRRHPSHKRADLLPGQVARPVSSGSETATSWLWSRRCRSERRSRSCDHAPPLVLLPSRGDCSGGGGRVG